MILTLKLIVKMCIRDSPYLVGPGNSKPVHQVRELAMPRPGIRRDHPVLLLFYH